MHQIAGIMCLNNEQYSKRRQTTCQATLPTIFLAAISTTILKDSLIKAESIYKPRRLFPRTAGTGYFLLLSPCLCPSRTQSRTHGTCAEYEPVLCVPFREPQRFQTKKRPENRRCLSRRFSRTLYSRYDLPPVHLRKNPF